MSTHVMPKARRYSLPLAILLGVLATVIAAFAFVPAQSGFTASINNPNNTFGSGTLLMSETQAAVTCLSSDAGITASNAGTCPQINKFGGGMNHTPGEIVKATVTIKNAGTTTANSFTLTPGVCEQSNNGAKNGTATDFCSKINVALQDSTTGSPKCVFPASATPCAVGPANGLTLANISSEPLALEAPLAPGASRVYDFFLQIDEASTTNAHQGLAASQSLTWAFAS
jgi:hypothetical protein